MKKKHVFTFEKGERVYCGDHYCSGHSNYTMNCSCGWTCKVESEYSSDNEMIKIRHVLDAEGLM